MEKKTKDSLYIIIPAYNEAGNIETTVSDWYRIVQSHNESGRSRLVVVNDGSTDETGAILDRLAGDRELLIPITKKNGGHGSAVLLGYHFAVDAGADWIFQTDSDGQTDPSGFEAFWRRRRGYDALFGSRTDRGDGPFRVFTEKMLCAVLFLCFGVGIPDSNAPFRLMSRAYLKRYLKKMPEDYNLPNVMLTVFGSWYHDRIGFIRIAFGPRRSGTNSIDFRKIFRIGIRATADFSAFRRALVREKYGRT
ncbi:MAG: glycosyltransferase family 2 protein [Lachnospiraceae bacterium]|jgi:glycosyltransferase involved in cell wall biosynthesis|nr:glycosyltransferase family 2 protein [Lachnospiraceae bacterium]MCI1328980.1 glycosyltransferase family 2 protein [Lachnospiraceae bacterium]